MTVLELDGLRVVVETGGPGRRATLTVEPDGSLRLRAAGDVGVEELSRFLAAKRDWVHRKLAEKEALQHEPVVKELVDGEGFLYLGRSHRLQLVDIGPSVRLERGRLILPTHLAAHGAEHLMGWYRRCGAAWLRPRMAPWAQRLQVEPGEVEVADLGRKWGSAGRRVRLHWATLQLPPPIVDYVLVHELAHLNEPSHGRAFWRLMSRVMPDYETRKSDLALEGSKLWFGKIKAPLRSVGEVKA